MKKEKQVVQKFKNFFTAGKQCNFKKGEIILRPDVSPSGLYFIEKGFVKVYWLTAEGNEKLHIIYKRNELFPLVWVLKEIQKDAYYEALDDVICWKVPKDDFLEFIRSNPDSLFELTARLINILNVFIERVDNLEIPKSYPRVIDALLFFLKRFGEKIDKGMLINVPITHKDIANSIALSRETVSREIEELYKMGLIEKNKHRLIIPSVKRLEKELVRFQEQM